MSKGTPIVAELGRAETADETAARKAESSRVYRSSQTFRHLIAALIVTVAVVAVIVFAVPRGTPPDAPKVDVAAVAAGVKETMQRPVLVPEVPDKWRANSAHLTGTDVPVWDVVLAPAAESERGFVHVAQAFDADVRWAPQVLTGTAPTGTVSIDGRTWDVFTLADPGKSANVSYAIGTQIGKDYVLLYGALSPDATAGLATELAPQLQKLSEGR